MIVYGIDPGSKESAIVGIDEKFNVVFKEHLPNLEMEELLTPLYRSKHVLAIEWLQSYGLAVGQTTFLTCRAIGRFEKAWGSNLNIRLYARPTILSHIAGAVRGIGKTQVRQALGLRFGGFKKGEPLFGVTKHKLDAFAIAVYHLDGAVLGAVDWGQID